MNKRLKHVLIISGATVCTIAAILLTKYFIEIHYRSKIPALPNMQSLSAPIKEQISSAFKKAYHHPTAENIGQLAMAYYSNAFYDKAAPCFKLAVKRDISKWIWSYYLAYLNQEMGDPHAAIENYRIVIHKNPQVHMAWYNSGAVYQKLGLNDSAEMAFNRINKRMDKNAIIKTATRYDYFPLVTYSMFRLARLYVITKQVDQAEKILLEIIDNQRAFGPAYRLLGNVYSLKGDMTLSKHYMVRANDLAENPSPVDTLLDKLSLMSRSETYILKKIDEAEKSVYSEYALQLVNHALIYIPENNYLIAKAIKLLLVRDMGKQALPYMEKHFSFFQNDFSELKSVGDLLYNKGFYAQATKYYSQAVKLRPADSKVQSSRVICLSKEGKKQQALDAVKEILAWNNRNPAVLADAVTLYLSLGEKEKAMLWLGRLKRFSPANPKGQQLSGMIAEQRTKFLEALTLYELAFKGDPEDLTTCRMLGNLLMQLKLWDKAVIFFRKALEFHPNEPFLLERLGTLLVACPDLKLRNIVEGRELCERAFIHKASHSITLVSAGRSLAVAYSALGDKRNASMILKMTINLAKESNLPPSYIADLEKLLQ